MDVLQAIHGRRAVRDFTDRKLDEKLVARLLDAAVWAPSGVNLQPWCFILIEDRATLAACSAAAKALMLNQPAGGPDHAGMRSMLAAPDFNIFYNAPALMLICATTPDEMALKDCCLAAENLMLAAHALGLGSCWIGFSEAWLHTAEAKARLGIPDGYRPVAPIILGHPAEGVAHASERRAPDLRRVPPEVV